MLSIENDSERLGPETPGPRADRGFGISSGDCDMAGSIGWGGLDCNAV